MQNVFSGTKSFNNLQFFFGKFNLNKGITKITNGALMYANVP